MSAGSGPSLRARLDRAANLVEATRGQRPAPLRDAEALRGEAERLRPVLESVAGRAYGRLPHVALRGRLEARLAGPWSQYGTLGFGRSRFVRLAPGAETRVRLPVVLAHELAHRYAFDESVTTLRGLEASARRAEEGDPGHFVAARLELARLLVGGALADALAEGRAAEVEAWLAEDAAGPCRLDFLRPRWSALRLRSRPDWTTTVYAQAPLRALEAGQGAGTSRSARVPFPRFPLEGVHAVACAAYTGVDALTRRRTARVPLEATLRLLEGAG